MADPRQERVCGLCKYPIQTCARGVPFSEFSIKVPRVRFMQIEPTYEWYEFDVLKHGWKYILAGEWEMFASIYKINKGDTLHLNGCSLVHGHLVFGHLRRVSGDIAVPRCTIDEYKAEQQIV
ncbi:unnamed protein product [Triticum turgidum subsp. durum]|uniref:Uncharacterized protein n=1 Tax=Triticum turgidum subsp. durum TaxID=4567 RepID=A0A9R0YV29_TRITD|nr:unnamed protein product [Triticum turgidum subsp. durum]